VPVAFDERVDRVGIASFLLDNRGKYARIQHGIPSLVRLILRAALRTIERHDSFTSNEFGSYRAYGCFFWSSSCRLVRDDEIVAVRRLNGSFFTFLIAPAERQVAGPADLMVRMCPIRA